MKRISFILGILFAAIVFCAQPGYAQIDVDVEIEKMDDDFVKAVIDIESSKRNEHGAIRIYDDDRSYYVNVFETNSKGNAQIEAKLEADKEMDARVGIGGDTEKISFETDDSFEKSKVDIWIIGYDSIVYTDESVYVEKDDSVLDVTERICRDNDIEFESSYGYVSGIGDFEEKEYGVKSGWVYFVDRKSPNLSSEAVDAKDGMEIVWAYTLDLGEDLGNIFDIMDGDMEILRDGELAEYDELFSGMEERGFERLRLNFKSVMDSEKSAKINSENDKNTAGMKISFDNNYPVRVTDDEVKLSIRSETFEKEATVKIEENKDSMYEIDIFGDVQKDSKIYVHMKKGILGFDNPFALSCYYMDKDFEHAKKLDTVYDMKSGEFTCIYSGDGKYFIGQSDEKQMFSDYNEMDKQDVKKIEAVSSYGIMGGYPDGSFRPQENVTRGEMAKIIYSFEKAFSGAMQDNEINYESNGNMLKDVDGNDWFYEYAAYCLKNGYMNGYEDGTFRASETLTREQAAVIIKRLKDGKSNRSFDILDRHDISPWAEDSVQYVLEKGIIKGYGDFKFRPKKSIQRIELARAIYEIMEQ